jgi:hypothetical protein
MWANRQPTDHKDTNNTKHGQNLGSNKTAYDPCVDTFTCNSKGQYYYIYILDV